MLSLGSKGSKRGQKRKGFFARFCGFAKVTFVKGFYRGEEGLGEGEMLFEEMSEAENGIVGSFDADDGEGGGGGKEVFDGAGDGVG